MDNSMADLKKIVIVGGGFGGLKAARDFNNKPGFSVLMIDRFNYHQFQPLFYQVATAGLDASNISFPLRKVFHRSKNVRFRIGEVSSIDTNRNVVVTPQEEYAYDILIIATGADTNFFGNAEITANSFPMKSTVEALQIRHRLLQNFEDALHIENEKDREIIMSIVIVGGGPTGVEMSGTIADMKRFVLPKDYPDLDFNLMKIYLVEGSPKVLGTMSDKSSADSLRYLQRLGVTVMTNNVVKSYDGKTVTLQNGETINTSMVIWAAGIKGNVPTGIQADIVVKGNRIKVDRDHKVHGLTNVYAIGDIAYMETELYPHGHPQVASVAIQQGDDVAKKLLHTNEKLEPFEYNDKGSMATVGRNLAVVDIPKPELHFNGFFAWLIWMGLHLVLILGVKNRLAVFSNWVYNYITYDQNLRLIFKEFYRPKSK
ncbi:MAG: NAD(P)/FAD-dependent oxidoreductase [Ginsengibacter sp.]